jgi:hypothetical protein
VTFTKCDVDVSKLLRLDQLRYVTFSLCYATFCTVFASLFPLHQRKLKPDFGHVPERK